MDHCVCFLDVWLSLDDCFLLILFMSSECWLLYIVSPHSIFFMWFEFSFHPSLSLGVCEKVFVLECLTVWKEFTFISLRYFPDEVCVCFLVNVLVGIVCCSFLVYYAERISILGA